MGRICGRFAQQLEWLMFPSWRAGLISGLIGTLALALATVSLAQAPTPQRPTPQPPTGPAAIPLPPPLPEIGADPELEPQVTIIRRETETVEEVRVNGQLRYVKVTPRFGLPYYLVPSGNGQAFQRFDSLDTGLRPPMWLLFSW